MRQGGFFMLIFFAVVMSAFITTAAPSKFISETSTTSGYQLQIVDTAPFATNKNITFKLHLFNSSDGVPVRNDAVTCGLHVYDNDNNYVFKDNVIVYDPPFEYTAFLDANNFTKPGEYDLITWCNSSTQGGAITESFYVTDTGLLITSEGAILQGFFMLVFMVIALFMLLFANQTDSDGFKIFFILIGFVIIIMTNYTMYISLQATPMSNNVHNMILAMGFVLSITFIILMYYVFINLTRRGLALMKAKKGFTEDESQGYF